MRGVCLVAGVSEADFWLMTIGEAARACDAYADRRKDQAYFAYTNAMAVGAFIASMFNKSQKTPTIEEIYPELFPKDEEAQMEAQIDRSAANFMKFANAINERFQNGNGKPESENNG